MQKLVVFFLFGLYSTVIIYAQGGETESIQWMLNQHGVLTLTAGGADIIAERFLEHSDFSGIKNDIQSVVIEDGIIGIGNFAFSGTNITSVSIPASLTTIGIHAFRGCEELVSISVDTTHPVFYSEEGVLINHTNHTLVAFPAGKTGDYTVPDAVEIIGECAFLECRKFTSVFIPQSVTTIGEYAFSATNLISVTIHGSTLTSIGKGAFQFCTQLTSISMPNVSVEYLSDNAFSYCNSLISFKIPDSVTSIGIETFGYCYYLTSVTMPASLIKIDDYAFWECLQLSSVSIPASVTHIGNGAFANCYQMTSISVDESNMVYSSVDGVLFNKDKSTLIAFPVGKSGEYIVPEPVKIIENVAFWRCKQLTSVILPATVTTINNHAFSDCSYLTSVVLPASVTYIGDEAFSICLNLEKVINLNPAPLIIPPSVFYGVNTNTCQLIVPSGSVDLYRNELVWTDFVQINEIDTHITLNNKEIYLLTGAFTSLTATVTGDVLSSNVVVWDSSQPDVASVDKSGKVTALITGSTVVTASAFGSDATCTVTVIQPGKSIIEGTITNVGMGNARVNLYIKVEQTSDLKKGIVGGYVLLATVVPNGNDEYSFENLPEGSYQVQVVIDDYEPEATDEIVLSGEETYSDINFIVEEGRIMVDADISTGAEELFASDLKAYPNPFTNVLHITGMMVETLHAASLQVINTIGSVVHTQTIANFDETIPLGHLPAGMYIIRLKNGSMVKTMKILKN